jgi:hypothetical protein
MTVDRDIERILDGWLADGPSTAPDRVLDAVSDRIERQRQRPAWRPFWRDFHVLTTSKMAAVVAAVLVIGVIGIALVLRPGGTSIGSQGPAAAPSPSAAPTPTPTPQRLPNGELQAGTYIGAVLKPNPLTWTLTVPAGWSGYDEWAVLGPETPDDKGVVVGAILNAGIPADSCSAAGTKPATSVAELVAAVQARKDWIVSEPVDVSIGGFSGTRIDLELPKNVLVCGPSKQDYAVIVEQLDGTGWYAQGASNRFNLWVLDVEGKPLVVMRNGYADSPPEQLSQSDAIVNSIVITP